MEKKIGIITYWSSKDNYGQILQCFALQTYLKRNGYDSFLIKYQPIDNYSLLDKFKRKIIYNLSVERIKYIFSEERKRHMQELNRALEEDAMAKKAAEECQFDSFRQNHIKSTNKIYNSIKEMRNNPPEADFYICGSDQVWNNDLFNNNTAGWFLDFGKARRISYAASIGRELKKEEQPLFKQYLDKFYAISVREQSALNVCRELGYENAQVTLDPALLLEKESYCELISDSKLIWKNKLFIYVLNIANKDDLHWQEIKDYTSGHGLDTEICCSSGYICARELIENKKNLHLTVGEWLNAIGSSEAVITSSFHGTVFSIIFHTPFVVIPLVGKNAKANDRIVTLLNTVGLEDRILATDNSIKDIMDKKIDWEKVDRLIDCSKISSIRFLDEALKGI